MTSKPSCSEEQHSQKAERLVQGQRSDSPEPSCVSMKSDRSMDSRIDFREDNSSSEISYVSMKSDQSMEVPLKFREEDRPADLRVQKNSDRTRRNMDTIFKELEHKVVSLVKNQLKRFVQLLSLDYPACSEREVEDEEDEELDEFDLRKYDPSEECLLRLLPVVKASRKAVLSRCNLTTASCEKLSSALQSINSSLNELDLSNNDLQDSGVELLSAGLKRSQCKLETLRLAGCNLTTASSEKLSSALQSVNSSLKKLDLSNNDLQDSGVELLCAGLKSSHCKVETLRLSGCMVTVKGCSSLASALKSNPSHLRELDLTYNHPGECGAKLLSDLLEDPHCKLEKLQVDHGGKIWIKPGLKKYAGLTVRQTEEVTNTTTNPPSTGTLSSPNSPDSPAHSDPPRNTQTSPAEPPPSPQTTTVKPAEQRPHVVIPMDSNRKFLEPQKLFPGHQVTAKHCSTTSHTHQLLKEETLGTPQCIISHTYTNDLHTQQSNTAEAVRRVAERVSAEFPESRIVISTLLARSVTPPPPHVINGINVEISRGCATLANVHLAYHPTIMPRDMYNGLHLHKDSVQNFEKTLKDAALGRNTAAGFTTPAGFLRPPPQCMPRYALFSPVRHSRPWAPPFHPPAPPYSPAAGVQPHHSPTHTCCSTPPHQERKAESITCEETPLPAKTTELCCSGGSAPLTLS
ncbi:hypothetical protein MHYP_G00312660 [Metynnis hypsauchen]